MGSCDGGCNYVDRQCRVLKLATGPHSSSAILCYSCFLKELRWREERNADLADFAKFDLPAWEDLPVYTG